MTYIYIYVQEHLQKTSASLREEVEINDTNYSMLWNLSQMSEIYIRIRNQ